MRRRGDKRMKQEPVPVRDRMTEVGINLNTIFTALVLAGVVWMGTTLRSIEKNLGDNAVVVALIQKDIAQLRLDLEMHRTDPFAHRRNVP